jgi:hypothetical protein
VKVVLSIVCSLALVWAQIAIGAPMPQGTAAKAAGCCGGKMSCCAAQPARTPQPLNANPAPAGNQNLLSIPSQNLVAWILPDAASPGFPRIASTLFASRGTALYARDCARLI